MNIQEICYTITSEAKFLEEHDLTTGIVSHQILDVYLDKTLQISHVQLGKRNLVVHMSRNELVEFLKHHSPSLVPELSDDFFDEGLENDRNLYVSGFIHYNGKQYGATLTRTDKAINDQARGLSLFENMPAACVYATLSGKAKERFAKKYFK